MSHNYNTLNSHHRDNLIEFDESQHKYSVNGKDLVSVTTIIDHYFQDFDADYWAKRKAPSMGLTPEQLKAKWEENAQKARDLGTSMHDKIEKYYLGITSETDETFNLFLEFTKSHTLYPYRTEWRIFYEEYGIAGTLDFLEYKDGVYTIYDWKRSEKLVKNGVILKDNPWGTSAFDPISHIPDTSFYHYALQLSMYRYILEQKYDIHVSQSRLGVFHPNNGTYHVIDLPYLKEEIIAILNDFKR
jgi:hypothetical protein